MESIIIKSILGVTIFIALLSCMVIILIKIIYHYKYLTFYENDETQNIDVISNLPMLIAPIFIRNKGREDSSKELAKLGITIRNLLIIFFSLLGYALIVSQIL
jgi:hypothetical protein